MNPGSDKLGFASSTWTDNILVDTAVARLEADTRTRAQFQFQTGAILIAIYFPYTVRLRPVLPSLRGHNVLASVNSSICLPLVNQ